MSALQDWRQRFEQLESREQGLLLVATLVIMAALIYLLVFKPLNHRVDQLRASHLSQKSLKSWMELQVAELKKSSNKLNQGNRGDTALSVLINQTAAGNQIQISRSQPRSNAQYQIWLDQVSFEQLINWLDDLQSNYGVVVFSINISQGDSGDQVRVNLVFQDVQ